MPTLFFCAIGGSGMLPLALMMKARGTRVIGSDRSYDQGRTPSRFAFIKAQGIELFPQDGSGITDEVSRVIVSGAVEETVPDYVAAKEKNIPIVKRAELLAELFNSAETSIGVAGTSGKSTTTGLTGWLMTAGGMEPSIINGAVMKNFISEAVPFASSVVGRKELLVAELDESDGTIALYSPKIAILNNIALDHKSMEELRALFKSFINKAKRVVLNLDNEETSLLHNPEDARFITFSRTNPAADIYASNITLRADGSSFKIHYKSEEVDVLLPLPGLHNISNALAALGGALAAGLDFIKAAKALESFQGIARRLDKIGTARGITVYDDFAHNPDKIAASLKTLRSFEGRLLVFYQPHGYGPLRLTLKELAASFSENLGPQDQLYLCDPLYLGGTTDKSVGASDLATLIGPQATHLPERQACLNAILGEVKEGDRIVIMGARDDSLTFCAQDILTQLKQ